MAIEHNTDGSLKRAAAITQAAADASQAQSTAQAAQQAVAGKLSASQLGVASGIATLDANSKLQQALDASKIASGTVDPQRLPDLSNLYLSVANALTITSYDGSAAQLKLIALADGSLKAVPSNAAAPAAPAGLAVDIHLSFVKFTWQTVSGASKYLVYRDGVKLRETTNLYYTDTSISLGNTYHYYVYAVNQYGMQSAVSQVSNAYIDPALNAAPTITSITIWPQNARPNDTVYIHVNGSDIDTQVLATTLSVNVGTLTATFDPTTWIWKET